MNTFACKVDAAVKMVCPIDGVSIGRKNDKNSWGVSFKPLAGSLERAAALTAMDTFDVVAALSERSI